MRAGISGCGARAHSLRFRGKNVSRYFPATAPMPGSDVVNKQTALGGAAGIALLLFALAWRFFPGMPATEPVPGPSVDATAPNGALVTAQAQRSGEAAKVSAGGREQVEQWGPPI